MTLLGPNDLKQFALPTGVDAATVSKYRLADGSTLEQVLNLIVQGLSQASEEIVNDPRYGGMFSATTDVMVEYREGAGNGMSERSEYSQADAKRGSTKGHMLPDKGYDRKLGWTRDFLERKARLNQLIADVADALYDVRNNWEIQLLKRMTSSTNNAIGSAGYDAPFVDASASFAYTPSPFDGATFASSHTHFDRKTDDATGRIAALNAGALHLKEHGILAPYKGIVPQVDVSAFTSLTGFVRPDRGYRYVRSDSGANWAVANIDEIYIGGFESEHGTVDLWSTSHLPTDYLSLYKSYGSNDQRNPLLVYYTVMAGLGARLVASETHNFPLAGAIIQHDFGVGVSATRLNGYNCLFAASGSYSNPTIS